MLPQESREIGGKRYIVTALGAEKGRRTLVRLLKVLGPALAAALKGKGPSEEVAFSLGGDAAAEAITELCSRLTEDEFEHLVGVFMESTEVATDGGQIPMRQIKGIAFAADYGSLLEWLAFCVEVNYSSFLAGLKRTRPQG